MTISRAMSVYSRSMGVSGECDIVEFPRTEDGIGLHGYRGLFRIFPVEYKKGESKGIRGRYTADDGPGHVPEGNVISQD